MSVLNWIVSQFDYLFFYPRRSSHSNCNSKNNNKTFKGNGSTESFYVENFAAHTGVLPTMTIRIKLTLRNKGFVFYWTGKWTDISCSRTPAWIRKAVLCVHCLVQHHNQWSTCSPPCRSWSSVTNKICISTTTKT